MEQANVDLRNEHARIEHAHSLRSLSDDELLRGLRELLGRSRGLEAELVAHVGEVDERRLFARFAAPSMFAYCTDVLRLSEAEAYLRIAAARSAREHPMLLAMLADGRLHLSAIALLAPHLTRENRDEVLARAAHLSKRQIQELVAELSPQPDAPTTIRKLPERSAVRVAPSASAGCLVRPARELRPDGVAVPAPERPASRRAAVEPTAPARYKVQFTASAELRSKLERLQALMRSDVPDGDVGAIIERAVTEKLQRLEARRFGLTARPRMAAERAQKRGNDPVDCTHRRPGRARHLPAAVKRAVRERDGCRCSYVDAEGRRCTALHRLEFHHRHPFGYGGEHTAENLSLLCRAHNGYMAAIDYGGLRAGESRRSALDEAATLPPRGPS